MLDLFVQQTPKSNKISQKTNDPNLNKYKLFWHLQEI